MTTSVFVQEATQFADNASIALITQKRLIPFLSGLGCQFNQRGQEYRAECPICHKSNISAKVGGDKHFWYWKCFNPACLTNSGHIRNLIGLVRLLKNNCSFGEAVDYIADFIGVKNPNVITNAKSITINGVKTSIEDAQSAILNGAKPEQQSQNFVRQKMERKFGAGKK